MERWTDAQWQRADFSGLLKMIDESDWPDAARDAGRDGTDGMCKVRKLYLLHHPAPKVAAAPEDDFEGRGVWEDEEGRWLTDFPPPDGFDGWEEGEPGGDDYQRELSEAEADALGVDEESLEAERAGELAAECAARDRYFGLDGMTAAGEDDKEGE